MISRATNVRGFQKFTYPFEEASPPSPPVSTSSIIPTNSLENTFGWNPVFLRQANSYVFGHPGFTPEAGRVTQGFGSDIRQREWEAEQILKRFGRWPPSEGELFVIQIDQDSPPPPPPRAMANTPPSEFRSRVEAWKKGVEALQEFVTRYTGQTVAFQARRGEGKLRLVELNPNGPLRSASHPGQLDPGGQVSCNNGICGMAWLRSGLYLYRGRALGVFIPLDDKLMDVARDINWNGGIDLLESIRSSRAYGFAILLHPGLLNSPISTGCQTFPPKDFNTLQKIILAANVDTFSYVLVRRPNDKTGPYVW